MKLEKEGKILPMVTYDEISENMYKKVTLMFNISELNYEEMKIVRKGQASKIKLTLELEGPILDEEERKYLSGVIRPFRDEIKNIQKYEMYPRGKRIIISLKDNQDILLPALKKDTMYKGMELNKEYTLDDLNL